MTGKNNFFFSFLLLIFISIPGFSQQTDCSRIQYSLKSWNTSTGLPQNFITAISQTPDGYLWLGTQEGLLRFNGRKFKNFTMEDTPAFPDNNVTVIHKDATGRMWLGFDAGGLVIYHNGVFTRPRMQTPLPGEAINTLTSDNRGNVWIGTVSSGVFVYHPDSRKLTKKTVATSIDISEVDCLYMDSRQNLWLAVPGSLLKIRQNSSKPVLVKPFQSKQIHAILEDRNGSMWIATENRGLFCLKNRNLTQWNTENGLPGNTVVSIYENAAGDIIAGTTAGIVRLMVRNGGRTICREAGLTDHTITCIAEDLEKNLWLGSYSGLHQLKRSRIQMISDKNGLIEKFTWSVYEDRFANLWVGTQSRGLIKISPRQKISAYSTENGLPGNMVRTSFMDSKDRLWVGTSNGLAVKAKYGWQAFTSGEGLTNSYIRAITEDKNKNIWIGTSAGVFIYRKGSFASMEIEGDQPRPGVFSFFQDPAGRMWAGTSLGAVIFTRGRGRFFAPGTALHNRRIFDIHYISKNNIWFSTQGAGLCHWQNNSLTSYTRKDGLLDNVIFKIIADRNRTLWLSTNKGIMSLPLDHIKAYNEKKISRLLPRIFGNDPGRSVLECSGGAQATGLINSEGEIIFPTIHGLAVISPDDLSQTAFSPALLVEKILADNINVPVKKTVVLQPGTRYLEFHFAALAFTTPTMISYRFRLDGYDETWNNVGNRNQAYYTNLAPGEYRFRVSSTRNDGTWNPRETTVNLYITPFFYQTLWFRILVLLLLLGVIALVYYIRFRSLLHRKRQLEHEVAQHTRKLRELSLKDPLTGLANRRFLTEVTEKEISAFVKYKEYLLKNQRGERRKFSPGAVFGIFLLDIDHFKQINDKYGHHSGDLILAAFADILSKSVRDDDIVIRWGGEEFLVILKKTLPDYMDTYCSKIMEKVRSTPFQVESDSSRTIHLTCSVGYCEFPFVSHSPQMISFNQTIKIADSAMYMAKKNGRNRGCRICAMADKITDRDEIMRCFSDAGDVSRLDWLKISEIRHG